MIHMKNILLIIGALLLSAPGFAQIVDNDFVSIPEPNASSFAKFIENPVNKFNGGADISIPVYTLKDGEIEIPITLRYNTSGIKVAEEASWVGLGWNLNVGGVITRNAVGLLGYDHMFGIFESYEDSYSGPLYPEYPSADMYTPWGWSGSLIKDPECHGFSSGGTSGASIDPSDWGPAKEGLSVGHGMPDIFYFSFLNYSGKFFIDHRDESIHIIDKSDDIQFTTYQAGTYWKATTPDGSSFYFEALSSSFSINSQTSSLSYYLTKIIYPNGRKVEFAYQTGGGTSQYALTENIHLRESTKHRMDPKYNSSMDRFSSGGRILSQILTDNFEINFTVNNRQDIPGDKKLDLITVIDNTTNQEKVFEFDNDAYFESQTGGNYWSGGDLESARKRLKLQAFGQKDLPKHIFNYSNIELPTKTSYAVDYWGYYNGAINNNTLIPSMNSYYLLSTIPDGTLAAMASYGGSAQKGCHPDIVSAGMLESITYPTGGKTSFNYESNSFTNRYYASIPDQQVYNQTVADQKIIGEANDDNCGAKSTWFPIDLDESANVKINFRFDKGIGTGADVRDAYGQISTRHPSQNYQIGRAHV